MPEHQCHNIEPKNPRSDPVGAERAGGDGEGADRLTWTRSRRGGLSVPSLYDEAITTPGGDVLTDVDEAAERLREILRAIEASADDAR